MPARYEAEEQDDGGVLTRERALRLYPAAEFFVEPLDDVCGAQRLPLRFRKPEEGEQFVADRNFLFVALSAAIAVLVAAGNSIGKLPLEYAILALIVAITTACFVDWKVFKDKQPGVTPSRSAEVP